MAGPAAGDLVEAIAAIDAAAGSGHGHPISFTSRLLTTNLRALVGNLAGLVTVLRLAIVEGQDECSRPRHAPRRPSGSRRRGGRIGFGWSEPGSFLS
jgi:hypothetical protein